MRVEARSFVDPRVGSGTSAPSPRPRRGCIAPCAPTRSLDLTRLRRELDAAHDRGRVARAIELGREAAARPGAVALPEGLAAGEAYERRLGLIAQYTRRDGASVLRALEDPSRRVRALAFSLVPLCCDDPQAVDGLQLAFALRRDRTLAVLLRAHNRRGAVDRHLDLNPSRFERCVPK